MHQRPAHNVADDYQLTAPEIHDNMIMIMIMRQADEEHCCLERLSYINKLDVLFKIKYLSKKELQHNDYDYALWL